MFKNFLSSTKKTWDRMSMIQRVFVVVAVITVVCSICSDCVLCDNWPVRLPLQQSEGFQAEQPSEGAKIVLYYVPWCPHCKNVMPEWKKLEAKTESEEVNNTTVKKVDCEQQPEEAQKQKVEGFPTILLFKDGKVINYDGERTAEALKEFIKNS
jgi:protein disulfide-isomerase-like protein